MTAVDEPKGTVEEEATAAAAAPSSKPDIDEGHRWWVSELLLMLELGGLAAFAFGRPILDTFGRSPETFVARGANALTIVLFGLLVGLAPFLVFGLLGLLGRPFGPTVRRRVHLGLVAVVGGFAVWQLGQGLTGYPPESEKLMVAGVLGGVGLAWLRASIGSVESFLRILGVASVVFLLQFLFMSPTSGLVTGGPTLDDEVARSVAADLGDDPPDISMFVFDALPTAALLDGQGRVDAELFPNFARVADTSTWYRDNSTVAAFTNQAVPAILTGRLGAGASGTGPDSENLFTLLGGSYEMHVREQVTRLCPDEICPEQSGGGLAPLLGDAFGTWTGSTPGTHDGDLHVPGALGDERFSTAEEWIAEEEALTSRPQFRFHHVVMPHNPWVYDADGELYDDRDGPVPGTGFYAWGASGSGIPVGMQRNTIQLQAADRLLGQELDRLEAENRLDDTLVVVTADHGNAFIPDEPIRGMTEANLEQVLWAPLFIKAPGQTDPVVDDGNVMSIDIVPTIASMLGVEMPWDVDGVPADDPDERRDDDRKLVEDHEANGLKPEDGEDVVELDDTRPRFEHLLTLDLVSGTGEDAPWKRTEHGELFGLAVSDLTVGDAAEGRIDVEARDDIESSTGDRPMAEVVGVSSLPRGTVVAYALNGTIGAVTTVEPGIEGNPGLVQGLLPRRLYQDGGNELQAFVIEGPVGAEVLRPIELGDAE